MTSQRSGDDAHSHTHSVHGTEGFAARDMACLLRTISIACGVLIVLGAIVLWPSSGSRASDPLGLAADPIDTHVTIVEERPCTSDAAQRAPS